LEVIDKSVDGLLVRNFVVSKEELDLCVDVVLNQLVYEGDVAVFVYAVVFESFFDDRNEVFDPFGDPCGRVFSVAADRFKRRRYSAASRMSDDESDLCIGELHRVQDASVHDLLAVVYVPDLVSDGAGREQPSWLFDVPHSFLRNPRVRTAHRDGGGFLSLLYVVEVVFGQVPDVAIVAFEEAT